MCRKASWLHLYGGRKRVRDRYIETPYNEGPRHRMALGFAIALLHERSLATKDCTVVIDSHN